MALEINPSGQVCGAAVTGVDLRDPLPPTIVDEIRQAWMKHHVLSFPGQELTDDELERFTLAFGPFGDDPYFKAIDGHPNIAAVHRGAHETGPIFAESWHADWSFQEFPPDGTCLYGKIIPDVGGDTWFIDQTAALAAMPADLRNRINDVRVIHSARGGYAPDGMYGEADKASNRAMKIVYSDDAYATQTHPLIRVHPETGAETLYGTIGYIIGVQDMEPAAATALLGEVYEWQTRDEFIYTHRWQANMLVMWDNRCILHRANGGYDGHERLLHRTTIGYNELVRG